MNKKLDETPVVVIFSFGSKGTKGNKLLAVAGAKETNGVVITQRDISKMQGASFWHYVEDFKSESGWHSTLWVATSAMEICKCREYPQKAIVIAAPMHLKRCARDLRKVGFEVMKMVSPKLESGSWYEKKSLLPWTRSWWRWWTREVAIRLLPWPIYKQLLKNK